MPHIVFSQHNARSNHTTSPRTPSGKPNLVNGKPNANVQRNGRTPTPTPTAHAANGNSKHLNGLKRKAKHVDMDSDDEGSRAGSPTKKRRFSQGGGGANGTSGVVESLQEQRKQLPIWSGTRLWVPMSAKAPDPCLQARKHLSARSRRTIQ